MARRPNHHGGVPSKVVEAAGIAKAGFLPRLFTQQLPRVKPFSEMGVAGVPVYAGYVLTPERNPRLVGQERYRTFADMLANTSIIAAGVRYFLNVIARPSWSCEPADKSDEAKKLADFANDVLYEEMHTPWSRIVRRAGMYRFHGFDIEEWTANRRDDGTIGIHDIEKRPQWTIWRWEVDERGTVIGAWQRDPLTGRELGLPRGKIMYLVDDTLTDSPEGLGILRHLAEPAERLKEYLDQESVGYMRDLRGIPLGMAPIDEMQAAVESGEMTLEEMNAALASLQSFVDIAKKGRQTSLIVNSQPYLNQTDSGITVSNEKKWGMDLIKGSPMGFAEISKAIDRLNYDMARIMGCEHLLLGSTSSGSFALAKEKASDLYLLANSVLRDIRLQAQHDILWPLWSLNGFDENLMPNLQSQDVAPSDVEQIARVMRDMATAGAPIPPDDEVINFIRDLIGAPQLDLDQYMREQMTLPSMLHGAVPGKKSPGAESQNLTETQITNLEDKMDARDDAREADVEKKLRMLRKVVGDTAADFIDDFVHSDNKKFNGKSKAERISMALGAFYSKTAPVNGFDAEMNELLSKVVPYNEAQPYRDEDEAVTAMSGSPDGHFSADDHFDPARGIKDEGPGDRVTHEGREEAEVGGADSDVLVPGSGLKAKGRKRVV